MRFLLILLTTIGFLSLVSSMTYGDSELSEDIEEWEQDQSDDGESYDEAIETDDEPESPEENEWSFSTSFATYSSWSDYQSTPDPSTPTSWIKNTEVPKSSSSGSITASFTTSPPVTVLITHTPTSVSNTHTPTSTNIDKGPLWNQPTKVRLQPENAGSGFSKKSMGKHMYNVDWKGLTVSLGLCLRYIH